MREKVITTLAHPRPQPPFEQPVLHSVSPLTEVESESRKRWDMGYEIYSSWIYQNLNWVNQIPIGNIYIYIYIVGIWDILLFDGTISMIFPVISHQNPWPGPAIQLRSASVLRLVFSSWSLMMAAFKLFLKHQEIWEVHQDPFLDLSNEEGDSKLKTENQMAEFTMNNKHFINIWHDMWWIWPSPIRIWSWGTADSHLQNSIPNHRFWIAARFEKSLWIFNQWPVDMPERLKMGVS